MKKFDPDKVDTIIIHCSDTSSSSSICVDDIERWHKARGFDCVGYHYVIKTNGEIQLGRSIDCVGAHCAGENYRSIGICYIGGRDSFGHVADTRTFAQKVSILYLICQIVRCYYPNIKRVLGHNDLSTKTCPNFDAKFEYRNLISNIKNSFN